ncbi:MAG: histidinol-phosphatase [Clostridia bacterium]
MRYASIHVHDSYSDGLARSGEYVNHAIRLRMETLGFSAHVPLPLENSWSMRLENTKDYVHDILALKKKSKGTLDVLLGMEIDHVEGMDIWEYAGIPELPLDYFLGAVHYVYSESLGEHFSVDPDEQGFVFLLEKGFNGDMEKLYRTYYEAVRGMIKAYAPPVVAHLDILRKNNRGQRFFREDDPGYLEEVRMTLATALRAGSLIEVNTGGMARGYTDEPYPSKNILMMCREMGLGVMVNSDAHSPDGLTHGYPEVFRLLEKAGFEGHHVLEDGEYRLRRFQPGGVGV